jgi:nucleotide-binding universal stress UspA family protein/predicted transcriptional regulator
MAFPFRNILCPVDFDDRSLAALDLASDIARQNDGTLFILHVTPLVIPPAAMPLYADFFREEDARGRLGEIARKRLGGVKRELLTYGGDPAAAILKTEKRIGADLIVMATHARRGFSRFFLGSIAEYVMRDSNCPVMCVRHAEPQRLLVSGWMTRNPVTAAPHERLSSLHEKMVKGGFRSVPIVDNDALIGIVTDRDVSAHAEHLEDTEARKAMSGDLVTVSPATTIREAARLLRERKIGALPVLEHGGLAGIITTSDVLKALLAEDEQPPN